MWKPSLLLSTVLISAIATAAEPRTEHTWQLSAGESRPVATIEDAAMLVGSWTGTAFGQRFEETWNPPSAGTMVGMFKLLGDDGVSFYELMLLAEEEGTLFLKVRHFNADFTAWEEKADYVTFKLVKMSPGELHFGGLSFYRRSDDRIDGYIVMRSGDQVSEQALIFERTRDAE